MPHPRFHETIDMLVFGRAFPTVHKWLDGCFDGTNGRTHWIHRHHQEAIEKRWRVDQYEQLKSARLHILVDWLFYYQLICVPKNHHEVATKLREHGRLVQ